jgi:hypothetical protein
MCEDVYHCAVYSDREISVIVHHLGMDEGNKKRYAMDCSVVF